MLHKKSFSLQTIVLVGVLSALVFALSSISIQIPLSFGEGTRIHFGNIMCLLSGVLFGPLVGGLSAGIGSMLYDFSNPLYASEFWITFLTKFAMGFMAGFIALITRNKLATFPRILLASIAGQLTYIVLYLFKSAIMQHYINGNPWPATWVVVSGKAVISSINGLIAIVACTLLAPPLLAGLNASGLFRPKSGHSAA